MVGHLHRFKAARTYDFDQRLGIADSCKSQMRYMTRGSQLFKGLGNALLDAALLQISQAEKTMRRGIVGVELQRLLELVGCWLHLTS